MSDIAKIPDPEIRIGLYATLLGWALKTLPTDEPVSATLDGLIDYHQDKFADFRSVDGARWVRNQLVHSTNQASPARIRTADAAFDPIIRRLAEQYCSQTVRDAVLGLPRPTPPPVPPPKPAPEVRPPVIFTPTRPIAPSPPSPRQPKNSAGWIVLGGIILAVLTIIFLATQQPQHIATPAPAQFVPPVSKSRKKAQLQAVPPALSQPQDIPSPDESSTTVGSTTDAGSQERATEEPRTVAEPAMKKEENTVIPRPQPTTVELLLQRAVSGIGGMQTLAGLRDSTTTSAVLYPDGRRSRFVVQFVAPGYRRQELELLSGGKTVSYTDGSIGWISTPSGVTSMPMKSVQNLEFYDLGRLLLSEHDSSLSVALIGTDAVRVTTQTGQAATLQFDSLTGLPARLFYKFGADAAEVLPATATFADWRPVSGLSLPFRMTIEVDGKLLRQDTVTEIRLNTGLTVAEISARP